MKLWNMRLPSGRLSSVLSLNSGLRTDWKLHKIFFTPWTTNLSGCITTFWSWVLPKFTDLNQYFQSKKVVITSLRSKICQTHKDLLLTSMNRDRVLHTTVDQIDMNVTSKLTPPNTMYLGVIMMQQVQQSKIGKVFFGLHAEKSRNPSTLMMPLWPTLFCLSPATATDPRARAEPPSLLPLMQQVPQLIYMEDADQSSCVVCFISYYT